METKKQKNKQIIKKWLRDNRVNLERIFDLNPWYIKRLYHGLTPIPGPVAGYITRNTGIQPKDFGVAVNIRLGDGAPYPQITPKSRARIEQIREAYRGGNKLGLSAETIFWVCGGQ